MPTAPHTKYLDTILGEWFPTLVSQNRFLQFQNRSISVCEKLDTQFFRAENFELLDKLLKDSCMGLLDLGETVYPRLVQLFYANLEAKVGVNGMYLVSLRKFVSITINRATLETVFGLKFTENAPSSLTRKMAKDLRLAQFTCP